MREIKENNSHVFVMLSKLVLYFIHINTYNADGR